MTTTTKYTSTLVLYAAQGSWLEGIEWTPREDLPGDGDAKMYDTIGKTEMFHHFMEHGCYPEPYNSHPVTQALMPQLRAHRNDVIAKRGKDGIRFRTRIVRRTIVSEITDEEVDTAMVVKNGEKT